MTAAATRQPIVVGVDGSISALHAVRWAAREAALRHLPVRLVHVCFLVPAGHVESLRPTEYLDRLLDQGRHWLREAVDAARADAPAIEIDTDLRDGVIAEVLIEQSAAARLVVLGSRGLGGFSGLLVGSVAAALAAHGHCPVAVMHSSTVDGAPPAHGPVVVGVDGSALSDAAVDFAFDAASVRGVGLLAVHTWLDVDITGAWTALPWTVDWAQVESDEERALAERMAGRQEKYPDVEVRRIVVKDRPLRALLKESAGAQLIVVGSRGRGAFTGMGLGSVSHALLHHAECPVVVCRPEKR